jgi:hypothetical protein
MPSSLRCRLRPKKGDCSVLAIGAGQSMDCMRGMVTAPRFLKVAGVILMQPHPSVAMRWLMLGNERSRLYCKGIESACKENQAPLRTLRTCLSFCEDLSGTCHFKHDCLGREWAGFMPEP